MFRHRLLSSHRLFSVLFLILAICGSSLRAKALPQKLRPGGNEVSTTCVSRWDKANFNRNESVFDPSAYADGTDSVPPETFEAKPRANGQTPRSPTDVVREFYKAMREHRFKDAWSMSVYKPAIEGLTADEMEDLRPFFEAQAAPIPEQIQIDSEKISGNTAQVFVHLPPGDASPQMTSRPVDLIKSDGGWIIGTTAEQETVKKAGGRYFLDALIDINQENLAEVLKRLIGMEAVYAQANNGAFGELKALAAAGLMSDDMFDPKLSGYTLRLTINGKTYVATAEPTHYGRTGKLSYWMDQTGAIKSADNGGKPLAMK